MSFYDSWRSVEFCPSCIESVTGFYLSFSVIPKTWIIYNFRMKVPVDHAESVGRLTSSVLYYFALSVHVPCGIFTFHHQYQVKSSDVVCILYHLVSQIIFFVFFFLDGLLFDFRFFFFCIFFCRRYYLVFLLNFFLIGEIFCLSVYSLANKPSNFSIAVIPVLLMICPSFFSWINLSMFSYSNPLMVVSMIFLSSLIFSSSVLQ